MTDDLDLETCRELVEADPHLKAAVDAVRADPEQFAEHLAGHKPFAFRQGVVESTAAVVSPFVANRLRRILMHPAATYHWPEAMELFSNINISVETALRALDALASIGGNRTTN